MKSLFLPIIGVAIFVSIVGYMFQHREQNPSFDLNPQSTPNPATESIEIGNAKIKAEIADSEDKRKQGLSGRERLTENTGTLFVFEKKDVFPSFWMKDMKFPLDIIWINDGKVVKIDKDVPAPPAGTLDRELTLYTPDKPIDYVLEVNSGFSDKEGIKVGDSVQIQSYP